MTMAAGGSLDAPGLTVDLEEPQAPCSWSGELQSLKMALGLDNKYADNMNPAEFKSIDPKGDCRV